MCACANVPVSVFCGRNAGYHPPQSKDIPIELNLHLLKDKPNAAGIMASKFVGEPPMILANAVTFSLKNAVYAARADGGDISFFQLDLPATPEKLQTLCGVTPSELVVSLSA
jgi:xanthine dehydrogenase/oxidase